MGGDDLETTALINDYKIIKNVAKSVIIDKNLIN
jgi:hypothetical protein